MSRFCPVITVPNILPVILAPALKLMLMLKTAASSQSDTSVNFFLMHTLKSKTVAS